MSTEGAHSKLLYRYLSYREAVAWGVSMMKRRPLLIVVLLMLLSALAVNAIINKEDKKPENEKTSEAGNADTPEVTDISGEKEVEFTEGIWIKKYSEDYACFKFETPDGYKIICDPYHVNDPLRPDIVTESHQDLDHSSTGNLVEPYELITDPGEYKFGDVVIRGFAGKHNKGDVEGTNNIFVFNIQDITIAHFASQGELPSDEVLNQIGTVDILLIQVFDNPSYNKLLLEDADAIISKLNPKIIIPEHAGPDAGSLLANHLEITAELEASGNIVITRQMLEETEGIRIIDLYNDF